jgi:hypothetical protein
MFFYAKEVEYPFGKYGWRSAKGGRYETALQVHAPNPSSHIGGKWSKESVLVQCNPRNGKGGFLRLEWNPATWKKLGAIGHLWGKLEEIMCSPPDFDEFLLAAKVTRLDLAIDIEGIRPDDCIWELPKAFYRNNIMKGGKLQTEYLGSNKTAKLRIYDKGAEMGLPELAITRVERVVKAGNLRLIELPALSNVFTGLKCYDVRAALAKPGQKGASLVPLEYRSMVHDACAHRGLNAAMGRFTSEQLRKAVKTAIVSTVPAFWDPAAIWEGWQAAIEQAFAYSPGFCSGQ